MTAIHVGDLVVNDFGWPFQVLRVTDGLLTVRDRDGSGGTLLASEARPLRELLP